MFKDKMSYVFERWKCFEYKYFKQTCMSMIVFLFHLMLSDLIVFNKSSKRTLKKYFKMYNVLSGFFISPLLMRQLTPLVHH